MTDVIAEQGAMIDGVANPSATTSRLGGAGHLKNAIAKAIADGTASATASRLGAQGRIYAIAGGGEISPGLSGGTVAWSPSALFASSEVGVWYDPSDLTTMWTDDGTTQAGVGDLVYRIDDKSGNGFHAKQTTEASRPVLRQTVGGLYYLEFDGTDDFLVTSAIDFSSTDKMSVFAGVRKLSDAAIGYVVDHNSPQATTNSFALTAPHTVSTSDMSFRSRGSGLVSNATYSSVSAPITVVATGLAQIGVDLCKLRINGIEQASSTSDQGNGNYASSVMYVGKRISGNNLNGHIYSLIVRGTLSDTTEIDNAEAYINGKTGAY